MKSENMTLDIQTEILGDYAILRPAGYLNALAGDQIDKVCSELIARGIRYFIINFGSVSMVNTIGISILVGIIEKTLERNGLVYFTELGAIDQRVFEVLNLSMVALIFESDEDAKAHLDRDQAAVRRAEQG